MYLLLFFAPTCYGEENLTLINPQNTKKIFSLEINSV